MNFSDFEMFRKAGEVLQTEDIEQFSLTHFVNQLNISRSCFYESYPYYTDFFRDLFEFVIATNNLVIENKNLITLLRNDLLFIAKNETLFNNLLLATSDKEIERRLFLEGFYFERVLQVLEEFEEVNLDDDWEIKGLAIQYYSNYVIYQVLNWIDSGLLLQNLNIIADLCFLTAAVFRNQFIVVPDRVIHQWEEITEFEFAWITQLFHKS